MSITRLALKVSIADARLPTTLMSFAKLSHMEDNLRGFLVALYVFDAPDMPALELYVFFTIFLYNLEENL